MKCMKKMAILVAALTVFGCCLGINVEARAYNSDGVELQEGLVDYETVNSQDKLIIDAENCVKNI